jgi:hypothetical protein
MLFSYGTIEKARASMEGRGDEGSLLAPFQWPTDSTAVRVAEDDVLLTMHLQLEWTQWKEVESADRT